MFLTSKGNGALIDSLIRMLEVHSEVRKLKKESHIFIIVIFFESNYLKCF